MRNTLIILTLRTIGKLANFQRITLAEQNGNSFKQTCFILTILAQLIFLLRQSEIGK